MGDFINPNAADGDKLFGYKLTGQYFPFMVTSGGIFLCYCLSSISQEYVYASGFDYTSFLTLCAKLFGVIWGGALGGFSNRKAPHIYHAWVGMLGFATMWLSNQSLLTLNYPTQTLFKSAKLIPVMIGALIINKKKFHMLEYLAAVFLLLGLVTFTLTDIKVTPNFDPVGVFFVSTALIADALIGNYQEKMFAQFGSDANEMMTYSNAWASLLSVFSCLMEGNNMEAIDFLVRDNLAILCIFLYCFLNILGIYFVLVMITLYGATLTAFTTSLRKALSIILSFCVYPKAFAFGYLVGGIATALGIVCNVRASQLKKKAATSINKIAAAVSDDTESGLTVKNLASMELKPLIALNASASPVSSSASPGLPYSPVPDSRKTPAAGVNGIHSALDSIKVSVMSASEDGGEDVEGNNLVTQISDIASKYDEENNRPVPDEAGSAEAISAALMQAKNAHLETNVVESPVSANSNSTQMRRNASSTNVDRLP